MHEYIYKITLFITVLFITFVMDATNNYSDDEKFNNKENYKNLYIIDTIQIKEPVVVWTKKGYSYVMSKKTLYLYNKHSKGFFLRPDVYFWETELPMSLPSNIFTKYAHGSDGIENLELTKIKLPGLGRILQYTKSPDYFLLVLIRGDYYNQSYIGLSEIKPIDFKENKFNYYKVAIPICNSYQPEPRKQYDPKYFPQTKTDSLLAR